MQAPDVLDLTGAEDDAKPAVIDMREAEESAEEGGGTEASDELPDEPADDEVTTDD